MAMTAESLRGPLYFQIDLKNGLTQQPIRAQLMKGDRRANTIIVALTDGKKPADLTGVTATGSFISPMDGAEIPLEGSVDGNEASVTLADECYAAEGYFEANVKMTMGETSRTILSITGHVLSKGSGAVIDVGGVIPNIDDIVAQYQTMKEVTASTQAAGEAAADAAENANNAAEKIDGMTVSAKSGESAGAAVSEVNGVKHITFTLPKGEKGDKGDPGTIENVSISSITGLQEALNSKLSVTGTAADAAKLGGKAPEYYIQPRNLLDNSDFTNPVNQRGQTSYTAAGYTIDRWTSVNSNAVFRVGSNCMEFLSPSSTGAYLVNFIAPGLLTLGKTYTVAICDADGKITARNGVLIEGTSIAHFYPIQDSTESQIGVRLDYDSSKGSHNVTLSTSNPAPFQIRWVALYEGAYTADTLPPYTPKGYAAELAECQRRFHVYETESARPSKPLDCCPPMELAPGTTVLSQGTITVDGKTLYYNSTDL